MRERPFHPESVRSILVVRLYFLGDVVVSIPVFEALKRRFPEAEVSVLVKRRARDVLAGNPNIDEIIVYDAVENYHSPVWLWKLARELRRRRFDLAVDLTGDHRSSLLLLFAEPSFTVGFSHAGFGLGRILDRSVPYRASGHVADHFVSAVETVGATLPGTPVPRIYLSADELRSARELLAESGLARDSDYIVIAPGAGGPLRVWPAERFGEVAALAKERLGLSTAVAGSPKDKGLVEDVVAASDGTAVSLGGRTSVRELAAVAAGAVALVGNDSGPLHVAAAVETPIVGILGPTTQDTWGPRAVERRLLTAGYPCSPCDQRAPCQRPDDPCIEAVSVEDVMTALAEFAGGKRA
jgi:lipopolysaccharide heptosyltransferase II